MIKTEERTLERRIEMMELQVVFPTPPLPPTKTHLRDSWSSMFCSVPSGTSVAISTAFFSCFCFSLSNNWNPEILRERERDLSITGNRVQIERRQSEVPVISL